MSDNADIAADSSSSSSSSALARTSLVAEQLGALWYVMQFIHYHAHYILSYLWSPGMCLVLFRAPPTIRSMQIARLKQVTNDRRESQVTKQLELTLPAPPPSPFAVDKKVTCDGDTILVTLPVDHRIGVETESAALGVTIFGVVCIALILCFLYFFHLRSTIKASSPLFLLATITGLACLFISGGLLARDAPTNSTCSSGWWMLNVGFFMAFGPLFAKTWRIYKIFLRKEMTVVKITDASLMLRLGKLWTNVVGGGGSTNPGSYSSRLH